MRLSLSALAASLLASVGLCQHVISLNGGGWTVHNSNKSINIPAQVPSQQYVDLHNHGTIGDPLYGFNDDLQSWVTLDNWTYVSPPLHQMWGWYGPGHRPGRRPGWGQGKGPTYLVFEGLDTFTHITLCDKEIGNTNNQYRQYTFDISDILASCATEPRLSINFGSAVNITHEISKGPDADGDDNYADGCNDSNEFGCKAYARKEQNDFGWDWSPSLAPAGPWRPIYAIQLARESPIYINNALVDIFRKGQRNNLPPDQTQPWVFNASLDYIGELPRGAQMQVEIKDASGNTIVETPLSDVYHNNMTITGSATIDPSKVELWWPNGMGSQTLYHATISVTDGWHRPVTSVERRVGFRTIVLNLEPISDAQLGQGIAPGANWHFEINGHEMYAKGSNFVPPSPFWPTVDNTTVEQLFDLVVEGNQNMLRVWASGAYLDDWIYDLADEKGILLWSEFQFSDAEYPNATSYLENYEAEAYYNVRRVNHHPSLALWAGGNELESIITAFFFGGDFLYQYQQIFLELLIKCVYANTRSISYIPSSTYHGYLSLDFDRVMPQIPRYLNTSGPDYIYLDTDSYNYDGASAFDLSSYPIGRFADEFGFHSMPSLQSWQAEAPESDFYLESPTVIHHNRHDGGSFGSAPGTPYQESLEGIQQMITAVEDWYPTPAYSDKVKNFTAWIYATQVFQAEDYARQIAFYRRGSGRPERQLGSLYWMLEDLWAAPTWASIDFLGRQKVMYYSTKDIYKPVIVAPYYNSTNYNFQVWATSDLWNTTTGTVSYEWFDWQGRQLKLASSTSSNTSTTNLTLPASSANLTATGTLPFTIGAINSTKILEIPNLHTVISPKTSTNSSNNSTSDPAYSHAILRLSLTGSSGGKQYTHTSFFHPTSLANVTLPDPGLKLSHDGSGKFTVQATRSVAAWVWLDYTSTQVKGYWSENGFWLKKGESKTVDFTTFSDQSGGQWAETVSVRSLYDNTEH